MRPALVVLVTALACIHPALAVELGLQPLPGNSCASPINSTLCDLGTGTVYAGLDVVNGKNNFNISSASAGIRIVVSHWSALGIGDRNASEKQPQQRESIALLQTN
jgi:hypothetical protein